MSLSLPASISMPEAINWGEPCCGWSRMRLALPCPLHNQHPSARAVGWWGLGPALPVPLDINKTSSDSPEHGHSQELQWWHRLEITQAVPDLLAHHGLQWLHRLRLSMASGAYTSLSHQRGALRQQNLRTVPTSGSQVHWRLEQQHRPLTPTWPMLVVPRAQSKSEPSLGPPLLPRTRGIPWLGSRLGQGGVVQGCRSSRLLNTIWLTPPGNDKV